MSTHVKTLKHRGYDIEIYQDDLALNPREEWDNFGTMVCFHRDYNLGDEHSFSSPEDVMEWINEQGDDVYWLPLFLYDHSGISMSTRKTYPFNDKWDSSMVGVIYVKADNEEIKSWTPQWKNEYHKGKFNKTIALEILEEEVKTYDQFLTGDVYYYDIPEVNESCGSFFGHDFEKNGLLESAKTMIDCAIQKEKLEIIIAQEQEMLRRFRQTKLLISDRAARKRGKILKMSF